MKFSRVFVAALFLMSIAGLSVSSAGSPDGTAGATPTTETNSKSRDKPIHKTDRHLQEADGDTPPPGDAATQQGQRKKLEKLPPAEAEPLGPMDETDPCPTLPC